MDEYEKKLTTFRKQRKKTIFMNACKNYLWERPVSIITSSMTTNLSEEEKLLDKNEDHEAFPPAEENDHMEEVKPDFAEESCKINWLRCAISLLIWICLFSFSVYIEFGVIFIILSGFYVIWTNTRTSPKKPHEISAYSVFNPNCEAIEGTYDAKQIESEIRYGLMF